MATAAVATPAPLAPTASDAATNDAALFGKYTDQHAAEVAKDLAGKPGAVGSDNGVPADGEGADPKEPIEHDADDSKDDAEPDTQPDGKPKPKLSEKLSDADAVTKARKAFAAGDTEALDLALKAILPGSKGLSEFTADGKRYAELRAVSIKRRQQAEARDAKLNERESNLAQGRKVLDEVVARYKPLEDLLALASKDDDASIDAFVAFVEKATRKPLNDTVKRHLDRKLNKPGDPELEAVKRELRAEKDKREAREREEENAKASRAHVEQIQRHLVFLDQTLKTHADPRVRSLIASPEGMREVFKAQERHYDRARNATLSPEQAALWVLEQKQKELEPWQRVLGGAPPPKALPAAPEPPKATPRAKPLGSRGNGASGGARGRLNDQDLFAKYERLAKLGDA